MTTIKVNNKDFNKEEVRQIFRNGRREIKNHGIVDENGVIEKTIKTVEKMVHLFGAFAEIDNDVEETYVKYSQEN